MINFEQKLPFRMHTGTMSESSATVLNKQFFRRWYGVNSAPFKLFTKPDRFLSFQIFIPVDIEGGASPTDLDITNFAVYDCNGNVAWEFDYSFEMPFEYHQVFGVGVWWVYKGEPIEGMELTGGYYYFELITGTDRKIISEMFYVPNNESEWNNLIKIEFWNGCDVGNVIYQTGYKNHFWLDTTLLKNAPTVEETGFENGFGEFQLELARYIDNYSLNDYVPEYIFNAFLFMQLNDNVHLTLAETKQKGKMRVKKVAPSWDNTGIYCEINVDFEQEMRMIKGACCQNLTFTSIVHLVAVADMFMLDANLYSTLELVTANLMTNDLGDPSKFVQTGIMSTTLGGSVQKYSDGTFKYSKPSGEPTPFIDTFNYTIEDEFGTTSTSSVQLKVDITTPIPDHFYVFAETLEQTNGLPMNVLTNDFIPVTYSYSPKIVYTGGTLIGGQEKLFDLDGSGNYILLHLTTGEVKAFNPAGKVPFTDPPDRYNYSLFDFGGLPTATAEIKISWE